MSATNPEESTNPEPSLTPAEVDSRDRLEATARAGLGTYLQVGDALTEIRDRQLYRDSHPSFEAYVREQWGVIIPNGDLLSQGIRADPAAMPAADQTRKAFSNKPCEALAKACEQTLAALAGDERIGIEIRLAVRKPGDPGASADAPSLDLAVLADTIGDELVPALRWLLTQATGTIGEVSHELETRAADIDDGARAQLRDDVLSLDGELAVVKALLIERHDWDSELKRLLTDEVPPFDTDTDSADDA